MQRTDLVYVLKVKVETPLTHLLPGRTDLTADALSLEFRGLHLKDLRPLDAFSIVDGSEIVCTAVPQTPERDLVAIDDGYDHLDVLIEEQPGAASAGTVKRIVSQQGERCQVCWRRRWFRAEVLAVYSTSLLLLLSTAAAETRSFP